MRACRILGGSSNKVFWPTVILPRGLPTAELKRLLFLSITNMPNPTYELKLHKSYYDKGFFNLGVAVDRYVRKTSGPATLLLGTSRTRVRVNVDRGANQNGTPRVMGGAKLRNWIQSHHRLGDVVEVRILGPEEYWLLKLGVQP